MRLHQSVPLAALSVHLLMAGTAFAQSELDRAKQVEAGPRAKKMHATEAPHSQLFVEQKDAPAVSKTAMHGDSVRLFDKAKD